MEAKLFKILHTQDIGSTSDPQFWFACQQGILLALKELGLLTEAQCRSAEEFLQKTAGGTGSD